MSQGRHTRLPLSASRPAYAPRLREPQYPDFPRAEYRERYSRLQRAMARRGLDAIVISNRTNHRYFTGFCAEVFEPQHYYFLAVLPQDEALEPVFLCTDFFEVAQTTWIDELRFWDWPKNMYMSKESPGIKLLATVLCELGLEDSTIGMELSNDMHAHIGGNDLLELRERLPRVAWIDGSDAMMDVRAIKSPAEIERLRKAAVISAKAVLHGFEALAPGMTEVELTQKMASRCYELGATDIRFLTNYAGPRRMWADATPTYYEIRRGDLVQFDGGCLVDGYWCDFKRMCSVGKPADEDLRHYEIAREAIELSTALLRAGAVPSDVVQAAFDVNRRYGYEDFVDWCHSAGYEAIGHGIGLDLHERPGLAFHNHEPLAANMVVSIEPFVTLDGVHPWSRARGKFGLEDAVLIGDDGHEILTSESLISHELLVV
jgi:Xaa-Pro aminopeptidase